MKEAFLSLELFKEDTEADLFNCFSLCLLKMNSFNKEGTIKLKDVIQTLYSEQKTTGYN